jgi:hypothetical protein
MVSFQNLKRRCLAPLRRFRHPKTVYFTVSSISHLNRARTLAQSIAKAMPYAEFIVFMGDKKVDAVLAAARDLKIIPVEDMGISGTQKMFNEYSAFQLNAAMKPFCFDYVFDQLGYARAVFLDADTFVLSELDEVQTLLDRGASCVLTPHITEPIQTSYSFPTDFDIMRTGSYNSGFVAFNNAPEARKFTRWWGDKLRDDCVDDPGRGIFVDQRYCEMAPAFLAKFKPLRHAGYNVAYWNLMHRPMTLHREEWWTCGVRVRFVHFSGIDVQNPDLFSKYQMQYRRGRMNGMESLYEQYLTLLEQNDHFPSGRYSEFPFQFGKGLQ